MKKTTAWTILATAAFTLAACDNKTADAVKEKADDAKQAIEAKSEAAKEAATKKIDEATDAAKKAAPAAAAAVDNMAEKAKDATSDAANATKEAADKAVDKVEGAAAMRLRRRPRPRHNASQDRAAPRGFARTAIEIAIRAWRVHMSFVGQLLLYVNHV